MMYSFHLSISRAAFRLCGTLESIMLPCSNTVVCESAFENCRQLKSFYGRIQIFIASGSGVCKNDTHGFFIQRFVLTSYLAICAFRGVRYGTCSVVQSLFTMNDTSMIYSGLSLLISRTNTRYLKTRQTSKS